MKMTQLPAVRRAALSSTSPQWNSSPASAATTTRIGQRDEHAQVRQRPAEQRHRTGDVEQRLPGEAADRVAVGRLDGQRLEQDDRTQRRQQNAQAERKVAGTGPGRLAEVVVRGTPRERQADDTNIRPAQKSRWLLIFTGLLLGLDESRLDSRFQEPPPDRGFHASRTMRGCGLGHRSGLHLMPRNLQAVAIALVQPCALHTLRSSTRDTRRRG